MAIIVIFTTTISIIASLLNIKVSIELMCSVKPDTIFTNQSNTMHISYVCFYHGATAPSGSRHPHYPGFTITLSFTHHTW